MKCLPKINNKDENLNPYSTAELDFIGLQFQVFKMLFLSGALRCLHKIAKILLKIPKILKRF